MVALRFRYDVGRYLLSRSVHRYARPWWTPALAPLRRVALPLPGVPASGWAVVRTRLCGICGSDLNLVTGGDSLYLGNEATYPFVPGHEIVGEVEGGRELPEDLSPGTRVAVWPPLGCATRGPGEPCRACAQGWDGLCEARQAAFPGVGLSIGFSRETGGGWSESFLAHHSQLWPLPHAVSDADAMLLDPAAAALAALLHTQEAGPQNNLVIGAGVIGLLCLVLARSLELPGRWSLIAKHPVQLRWAEGHGHDAVALRSTERFRTWLSGRGATSTRVRGYGQVFRGVFDRVVVAAGSESAFRWALEAVAPRGVVALVSAPASLRRFDPTPLWYRGLLLRGIHEYGPVPWEGASRHPYDVLLPRLASGELALAGLVTHTFPLSAYREALGVALDRRVSGAIKVAFAPRDPRS